MKDSLADKGGSGEFKRFNYFLWVRLYIPLLLDTVLVAITEGLLVYPLFIGFFIMAKGSFYLKIAFHLASVCVGLCLCFEF